MQYPQFVANLTDDQGIGIAMRGEPIEDTGLEFCQFYGSYKQCEKLGYGGCSHDGNLWGSNDMGSPLFCTNHAYPQEQLGYEFVEMEAHYANATSN